MPFRKKITHRKQYEENRYGSEPEQEAETPTHDLNVLRTGNDRPVLANFRDLLVDAGMGYDRNNTSLQGPPLKPQNLLNTTYSIFHENLLLDLNMLFEEVLQILIEHEPLFVDDIRAVVTAIHTFLDIDTVKGVSVDDDLRKEQVGRILKRLCSKYSKETLKEIDNIEWDVKKISYICDIISKKISDCDAEVKPTEKDVKAGQLKSLIEPSKDRDYITLVKMLNDQGGVFGGSVEYANNKDCLEYYIYHLSTLTRNPDRKFYPDTDKNLGYFKKPFMDYRTHKHGLVPFYNQINLGTGVTENKFEMVPPHLQNQIKEGIERVCNERKFFAGISVKNNRYKARERATRMAIFDNLCLKHKELLKVSEVSEVWDSMTEGERTQLIGTVLQIPFNAYTVPPNVSGVYGNYLETPAAAINRYITLFEKLDKRAYLNIKDILPGDEEAGHPEAISTNEALVEFYKMHEAWRHNARKKHLPMIGGISGHTLGFLNLYQSSLERCEEKIKFAIKGEKVKLIEEKATFPTLERLRFILLGGLIGTKRHHSYDEVMTASAGMPSLGGRLSYFGRDMNSPYVDILTSDDNEISSTSFKALQKTKDKIDSILTSSLDKNSLLSAVKDRVHNKKEFVNSCEDYILLGEDANLKNYTNNVILPASDRKKDSRRFDLNTKIEVAPEHIETIRLYKEEKAYEPPVFGKMPEDKSKNYNFITWKKLDRNYY